jgi:hypothetical protein
MAPDRRATRWRSADEPCLNCADPTTGRYCANCGQRKIDVLVSLRTILADVLEDQLVINRALPHTIAALLLHPGFLTEEYVRGRIVRYIAPFRLYIVTSVLFFLVVSFLSLRALEGADLAVSAAAGVERAQADLVERRTELLARDTTTMSESDLAATRQALADVDRAHALLEGVDQPGALPNGAAGPHGVVRLPPGMLQPWAQQLQSLDSAMPFHSAIQRKLGQIGHLPQQDALRAVVSDLLDYAPHMMFLLLPVFAFILKLLYIRRDRFYAEHFVFALHVHSFFFLMFFIMLVTPGSVVDRILILWMVAYIWLAMKRVYQQGWVRTSMKWWILGWCYFFILFFGLLGLAATTILLI